MAPWEPLSRAPMVQMMNRSFNRDRCCPFPSYNGPVLQRDWDVDYIMACDVLYIRKTEGTCCFHPSSVTCKGQDHGDLAQKGGF